MIPERPTLTEVCAIKAAFPPGTIVELITVDDPYRILSPSTRGVVTVVDDIGTLHVRWSDEYSFGIVPGVDDVVRTEDGAMLSEIVAAICTYPRR